MMLKELAVLGVVLSLTPSGCAKAADTGVGAGGGAPTEDGGLANDASSEDALGRHARPAGGKFLFVSSALHDGNFGGLVGADAFCTRLATAAELGGKWRAYLATAEDPLKRQTAAELLPATRLGASTGPWYLVNGTLAFPADAAAGTIPMVPLDVDENGVTVPVSSVWVGAGCGLADTFDCCKDWTSTATATYVGDTLRNNEWSYNGQNTCDEKDRVFCFEVD